YRGAAPHAVPARARLDALLRLRGTRLEIHRVHRVRAARADLQSRAALTPRGDRAPGGRRITMPRMLAVAWSLAALAIGLVLGSPPRAHAPAFLPFEQSRRAMGSAYAGEGGHATRAHT